MNSQIPHDDRTTKSNQQVLSGAAHTSGAPTHTRGQDQTESPAAEIPHALHRLPNEEREILEGAQVPSRASAVSAAQGPQMLQMGSALNMLMNNARGRASSQVITHVHQTKSPARDRAVQRARPKEVPSEAAPMAISTDTARPPVAHCTPYCTAPLAPSYPRPGGHESSLPTAGWPMQYCMPSMRGNGVSSQLWIGGGPTLNQTHSCALDSLNGLTVPSCLCILTLLNAARISRSPGYVARDGWHQEKTRRALNRTLSGAAGSEVYPAQGPTSRQRIPMQTRESEGGGVRELHTQSSGFQRPTTPPLPMPTLWRYCRLARCATRSAQQKDSAHRRRMHERTLRFVVPRKPVPSTPARPPRIFSGWGEHPHGAPPHSHGPILGSSLRRRRSQRRLVRPSSTMAYIDRVLWYTSNILWLQGRLPWNIDRLCLS